MTTNRRKNSKANTTNNIPTNIARVLEKNNIHSFADLMDVYYSSTGRTKTLLRRFMEENVEWWGPIPGKKDSGGYRDGGINDFIINMVYRDPMLDDPNSVKKWYKNCLETWNKDLFIDQVDNDIEVDCSDSSMAMKQKKQSSDDDNIATDKEVESILAYLDDLGDNPSRSRYLGVFGYETNCADSIDDKLYKTLIVSAVNDIYDGLCNADDSIVSHYNWIREIIEVALKAIQYENDPTVLVANIFRDIAWYAKSVNANDFKFVARDLIEFFTISKKEEEKQEKKVAKKENVSKELSEEEVEDLHEILGEAEDYIIDVISNNSTVMNMAQSMNSANGVGMILDLAESAARFIPSASDQVLSTMNKSKAEALMKKYPNKEVLVKAFNNPTMKNWTWAVEILYDAIDEIAKADTNEEILDIISNTISDVIANIKKRHMKDVINLFTKIKEKLPKNKKVKKANVDIEDLNDIANPGTAVAMKQHHIPDEDELKHLKTFVAQSKPSKPKFVAEAPTRIDTKPEAKKHIDVETLDPEVQDIIEKFPWVLDIMNIAIDCGNSTVPGIINTTGNTDAIMFITYNGANTFISDKSFCIDNGTVIDRNLAIWPNVQDNDGEPIINPFEFCNIAFRVRSKEKTHQLNTDFFRKIFTYGFSGLNKNDYGSRNVIYTETILKANRRLMMITRPMLNDRNKDGFAFFNNASIKAASAIEKLINIGAIKPNTRFRVVNYSYNNRRMEISSIGVPLYFCFNNMSETEIRYEVVRSIGDDGNVLVDEKGREMITISVIEDEVPAEAPVIEAPEQTVIQNYNAGNQQVAREATHIPDEVGMNYQFFMEQ